MDNKCTIIVMGCDEYIDVLEINGLFKKRYWEKSDFEYILVTQTKEPKNNVYDRIIYTSKDTVWMDRLALALNSVKTNYLCIMCDDYFYSEAVDDKFFYEAMDSMEKHNVGLLKIIPTNFIRDFTIVNNRFKEYDKKNSFRISYYPSIWKTDYLKNFSQSGLSVWQAERDNSLASLQFGEKIWTIRKNELNIVHAIMSGKWTRESIKFFNKEKLEKKMYSNRNVKTLKMYLKDVIYNILMTVSPKYTLSMQRKLGVGRK